MSAKKLVLTVFVLAIVALSGQLFFGLDSATAQTVQLPTVSSFGIGTTVVIPDRGAAYLGGVHRASEGSSSAGVPGLSKVPGVNRLFSNRGIGKSTESSSVWASATIIDHAEIDAAILGDAAQARARTMSGEEAARAAAISNKAAFLARHVARRPAELTASANATKTKVGQRAVSSEQVSVTQQQRAAEAEDYFEKGNEALRAGKNGVAKIYYEMAHRRATGELKTRVAKAVAMLPVPQVAGVGNPIRK